MRTLARSQSPDPHCIGRIVAGTLIASSPPGLSGGRRAGRFHSHQKTQIMGGEGKRRRGIRGVFSMTENFKNSSLWRFPPPPHPPLPPPTRNEKARGDR